MVYGLMVQSAVKRYKVAIIQQIDITTSML